MSWADITPKAKANVNDVLNSGWISRHKYIPRLEELVASRHGAKYGIFMNSGTDALRISLLTLKEVHKWPDGAEVIVPALTFVATANAVLQARLRPIFSDVDLPTGNLKVSALTSPSKSIVAAVPVHLFGLPVTIPRTSLRVIEDSCETVGVHKLAGDMACFSFFMSHHITAGVGGMIVTNSPRYERVARSYMNHGRTDDGSHFKFGRIGYSSRATEMEAALGCAAMETLDDNLRKRNFLANLYTGQLDSFSNVLQLPPNDPKHSWMFYPLFLKKGNRDKLLNHLRINGIESREAMPIINQPCYKGLYQPGSCPNAEVWTKNGILLPLHPLMDQKQVEYVTKTIGRFFN